MRRILGYSEGHAVWSENQLSYARVPSHRGELVTGLPGEVARNREDQRKHKAKLEAGK